MSPPAELPSTVSARELCLELGRSLSEHLGSQREVVKLERRPSPYRTSFAIEELEALLDDDTSLRIVFKDLSPEALSREARDAKPSFLRDPLREIETYRSILSWARLGTAVCYGARVDRKRDRFWLFLENVSGDVLWQIGDIATWELTASWLGRMHARFADDAGWQEGTAPLLCYDAGFYRIWLPRARAFARKAETADAKARRRIIEWLADRYEKVVERLSELPVTFIHGEFYASNVLISSDSRRVCPIDWENAAVGPGLIDLAALTTGNWSSEERGRLALAYHRALREASASPPPLDDFLTALDYCHLHLAVQWLGWASDWSPPAEHQQDWLGEALRLGEELDL